MLEWTVSTENETMIRSDRWYQACTEEKRTEQKVSECVPETTGTNREKSRGNPVECLPSLRLSKGMHSRGGDSRERVYGDFFFTQI